MSLYALLTTGIVKAKPMMIGAVVIVALAASGYAYHKIKVLTLNNNIQDLQAEIAQLNENIQTLKNNQVIYEATARENEQTIVKLQARIAEQAQQAQSLTVTIQKLNRDKQEYLEIFRKHDLTNLSRVKPGLIESRINQGTADVFDSIESDTKE